MFRAAGLTEVRFNCGETVLRESYLLVVRRRLKGMMMIQDPPQYGAARGELETAPCGIFLRTKRSFFFRAVLFAPHATSVCHLLLCRLTPHDLVRGFCNARITRWNLE